MEYLQTVMQIGKEYVPALYYVTLFFGFMALLQYVWTIVRGIVRLTFQHRLKLAERYGQGSWVLVTGASDGIGKEFAFEFAKQGFNILILARTESKLQKVKQAIQAQYPRIQVDIIVADLVQSGSKDKLQDVLVDLSKYDISVVVNNAGVDILDQFIDLPIETITNLIQINCFALTAITYLFLRRHQERIQKTGKRCSIINVASVAGEMPMPLHNIYSASKAYVNQLTKNLTMQYPEIDWLVLRPSEVSTPMTCHKPLDIFTITARQCAVGTLNDLGHVTETNGFISHKIQSFIYQYVPQSLFNLLWTKVFAPEFMQQRKEFHQKLNKKQ